MSRNDRVYCIGCGKELYPRRESVLDDLTRENPDIVKLTYVCDEDCLEMYRKQGEG